MFAALDQLMRHHPAYLGGRREHNRPDSGDFEELESRHLRRSREHEFERSEPTWGIGELVATAVVLTIFLGGLTLIARLGGDASDAAGHQTVAVSQVTERR